MFRIRGLYFSFFGMISLVATQENGGEAILMCAKKRRGHVGFILFLVISCSTLKRIHHTKAPKMAKPGNRIPATLQAVFLASNRGMEVDKPPAEADMVYRRNWRFQGQPGSKSLFGDSKEKICSLKRTFSSDYTTKGAGEVNRRTSQGCAGGRKSLTGNTGEVRADQLSVLKLPAFLSYTG
jgi:hypothetical protein